MTKQELSAAYYRGARYLAAAFNTLPKWVEEYAFCEEKHAACRAQDAAACLSSYERYARLGPPHD